MLIKKFNIYSFAILRSLCRQKRRCLPLKYRDGSPSLYKVSLCKILANPRWTSFHQIQYQHDQYLPSLSPFSKQLNFRRQKQQIEAKFRIFIFREQVGNLRWKCIKDTPWTISIRKTFGSGCWYTSFLRDSPSTSYVVPNFEIYIYRDWYWYWLL